MTFEAGGIDDEEMEKLAAAVHVVWMEGRLRDGWKLGSAIDKEKKIHSCLLPYDQLSEQDKESDRDMVRGIPRILEAAGYKIVKTDDGGIVEKPVDDRTR